MAKIGNRRKTDVSDAEIVAAYANTHSVYVAEKTLGVSVSTIYRVLERCGVKRVGLAEYRENAARFDVETSRNIRNRYEEDVSFADLVREFGGSEYSIKKAIVRAGGSLKPVCPPASSDDVDRVVAMYGDGISQMKISLEIGRSQSFVSRILRKQGIKPRHQLGKTHGMWQGGRFFDSNGYVRVIVRNDDPMASMRLHDSYVLEHRLVMARSLGRPLRRTESIHHINGDKADNRLENLELRQGKHGKHIAMRCLDCGSHNVGPVGLSENGD